MDCSCSPDVGDCPRCHPEMWIQKGGSFASWIPKGASPFDPAQLNPFRVKGGRIGRMGGVKGARSFGVKGARSFGVKGVYPFSRKANRPFRRQVMTRKKRTY